MAFRNSYEDATRADAYATLAFKNTYYLAFRDLPAIIREHVKGFRAVDFGCGTGRSTRFLRQLAFEVTGVDIAEEMIGKAREIDPKGDYRLVPGDNLSGLQAGAYDLVLSAFTFDNIAGREAKIALFKAIRQLLSIGGKIVHVVSAPEIYTHEWASFSTRDFPENRNCHSGDKVKIMVTDHGDRRPVEDILWTEDSYRDVFTAAGLRTVTKYEPLASGHEPYPWVNETRIAPWAIYVLEPTREAS